MHALAPRPVVSVAGARAGRRLAGEGPGPRARPRVRDPPGVRGAPGDPEPGLGRAEHPPERRAHRADAGAARASQARLLEGEGGPPAVYGELRTPGARRTVLFYAHYDGQPVDPAKWASPPWTPVLRDKPVDDGGREIPLDVLASPGRVAPLRALHRRRQGADRRLPGRARRAEGRVRPARPSTSSSSSRARRRRARRTWRRSWRSNRDLLEADAWLLCDGPVHQTRRMQVFFGARGVTGLELTVYGPCARSAQRPLRELGAQPGRGPRRARGRAARRGRPHHGGGLLRRRAAADARPSGAALAAAPDVDAALRAEFALAADGGGRGAPGRPASCFPP